ncbi:hypothetical protein EVAR_43123_1 [Eumeta japonica]|uniref:Uncharacterized protein n=1 Tax=Eumeta variegata TaxID=151549 RepID=A0A4C1XM73_EUMVA|nr:hypothetical protein EVAR_43123_1 [Eumeta japonica]
MKPKRHDRLQTQKRCGKSAAARERALICKISGFRDRKRAYPHDVRARRRGVLSMNFELTVDAQNARVRYDIVVWHFLLCGWEVYAGGDSRAACTRAEAAQLRSVVTGRVARRPAQWPPLPPGLARRRDILPSSVISKVSIAFKV